MKLATHTLTGEHVAIKVLEKAKMCTEADITRVTREVNILKQIKHPNISQLYQIIETPNKICLVLEYMGKGELYDLIVRHKKLHEGEAARYFIQLLQAVRYMHSQGVSHRDLKPENLLLDENANLKVIDFGLSNHFGEATYLKTACGSPCYAAPEMVSGQSYSGSKVDMWSCGVVLYAMTVGKLPFDDPNSAELYRKIISGRFSFPGYLTDDLKDLISGLLRTNPDARYDVTQSINSVWLKNNQEASILKDYQSMVLPLVLSKLREIGVDAAYTKQCLEGNKHNQATTAYFLMLKKMLREGLVPRLDSTKVLKPLLPEKAQTTRANTSSFSRHSQLVNAIKAEEVSPLRNRFNAIQTHHQPPNSTMRPSISPARRVFKPAEGKLRGLTPHQPSSRGRSTSQTRSQSHKRSTSNGRGAQLALKRYTIAEASSVCWTSNKSISEVTEEIMLGFQSLKYNYRHTDDGFVWDFQQVLAELCMRRLGTLTIVKCKLLAGPAQAYRDCCSRLLCRINL